MTTRASERDGVERVQFTSDGLALVGDLRVPERPGPHPAVVFTGPLTGVKEQVTGTYAQRLTAAGYVTLAFDHRNFGGSGGSPRQHEDSSGKISDLRDAVSYLATRDDVDADRIAVCGVCLGTSYALKFTAFDPRVRSVALVAGAYNDPAEMRRGMGDAGYREQLARFAEVAQRQYATGEVEYMAAVGPEGPAAMPGSEPYEYYGTDRASSPGWENRVTVLSIRELITLDAAGSADFLAPTPALVVHGRTDAYCSPEGAQAVYERMTGPKDFLWLDTTCHIDLYDVDDYVGPAVEAVTDWFHEHL